MKLLKIVGILHNFPFEKFIGFTDQVSMNEWLRENGFLSTGKRHVTPRHRIMINGDDKFYADRVVAETIDLLESSMVKIAE